LLKIKTLRLEGVLSQKNR